MDDRARTSETRGSEPAQIRREIQRTRSAMDHTVDELAERLSPSHLLDEVWHRVRSGGIDGIGSAIRDHPVPVALMGLGLGWLAIEQATGRSAGRSGDGHDGHAYPARGSRSGPGTWEPAEGRRGPYRGDAISGDVEFASDPHDEVSARSKARDAASSAKDKAGDMASRTKQRVAEAASTVKEKISGAAHSARDSADDAVDSVRHGRERAMSSATAMREGASSRAHHAASAATDATSAARHGARSAGRRARSTFSRLMEDNPLAVGAVAFGLGLASGVSAPSTSTGDRSMGRASERDLDATAAEGVRRAKRVAAEIAKETEEAAREVGSAAKKAAEERVGGERAEGDGDDTPRAGGTRRSSVPGPSPSAGSTSHPGSPPKP